MVGPLVSQSQRLSFALPLWFLSIRCSQYVERNICKPRKLGLLWTLLDPTCMTSQSRVDAQRELSSIIWLSGRH